MPSSHDNASSFLVRVASVAALAALAVTAHAGPREQAKRIHDRIAGVPPSSAVLDAMEAEITGGDTLAAAMIAMDNPSFYSVTLKNLVTPWTNRAQTVFEPLNDYTATVIGMVRDDLPFNTVLSADVLYVGAAGLGLPAVSPANNDHYEQMEARGVNLLTGRVEADNGTLHFRADSGASFRVPRQVGGTARAGDAMNLVLRPENVQIDPPGAVDPDGIRWPGRIVQAVYTFAARHPEVLRYVPCFCGCESRGHTDNEDCFIAGRDANGRPRWEEHGMG